MKKMTIVIMFRNGTEVRMKCDSFKVKKNGFESLTEVSFEGCTENLPLWFDGSQILCIYRVMSDEQD